MGYKIKQKMLWAVIVLIIAGFLFITLCLHSDDSYSIGTIGGVDGPQDVIVSNGIGPIGGVDDPQDIIISNGIGTIGGVDGPQNVFVSQGVGAP